MNKRLIVTAVLAASGVVVQAQDYVFFDDFNASDADDANWGYVDRQANGEVLATWSCPTAHEIVDGKLNVYQSFSWANPEVDFAPYIQSKDFEFSIKVQNAMTNASSAMYLYDENDAARSGANIGLRIEGTDSTMFGW